MHQVPFSVSALLLIVHVLMNLPRIPLNRLACHACNDVEKQCVAVVSVLRLLVDDGEDRLKVSVSGNVGPSTASRPFFVSHTNVGASA